MHLLIAFHVTYLMLVFVKKTNFLHFKVFRVQCYKLRVKTHIFGLFSPNLFCLLFVHSAMEACWRSTVDKSSRLSLARWLLGQACLISWLENCASFRQEVLVFVWSALGWISYYPFCKTVCLSTVISICTAKPVWTSKKAEQAALWATVRMWLLVMVQSRASPQNVTFMQKYLHF